MQSIASFYHKDGYIFDDYVYRSSVKNNIINQLKCRKIPSFRNDEYKRAESRQCYAALLMYDKSLPNIPIEEIISKEEIPNYLRSFDWNQPWGAGSHYSHMLFFQRLGYICGLLTREEYNDNISCAKTWIGHIQDKESGSWFIGETTSQQAINGAMKVLTGFNAVQDLKITEETGQKLIDLCLNNINNGQACDNFNIIYVLKNAMDVCKNYRKNAIVEFAENRFDIYIWIIIILNGEAFPFIKEKVMNDIMGVR